jgi:hypothetical protein
VPVTVRMPSPRAVWPTDCHASPLRVLEISQIRRRLVLLGRHQEAIGAQEIVFFANHDLRVVLGAIRFGPVRTRIRVAPVSFVHRPGPRQGN